MTAVELRPGVAFPHWPAVTAPNAKDALAAILGAGRRLERFDGYGDDEDRVRRAIITGLAALGRVPAVALLARSTGLSPHRVAELVDRLVSRDLVVRDKGTDAVVGAHPLTSRTTEHRVKLPGRTVHAMCAVDALGAGAMCGADVTIESHCRTCGAPIRITTKNQGTALDIVKPATTEVWSGIRYEDGCAATSLCTVIAFFCTGAHREEWRQANYPDVKGYRLTPDEAMQVGRAIFSPLLKPRERIEGNKMMNPNKIILTCGTGSVITAICCFTPVLVVALGAVGLSAWLGWLDYVLFPMLAVFVGMTAYGVWLRQRQRTASSHRAPVGEERI